MFVSSHRDLRRLFFTFVVVVYSVVVLSLYAVTRVVHSSNLRVL